MQPAIKYTLYVIIFFAVVLGGDRLFSYLLIKGIVSKSQLRYSRLYNKKADCDIYLMGNSRGLSFYQPYIEQLTRKKTFNVSYNGMPTNLGLVLLQDYLEHNKKPGLVVIEATMQGERKRLVPNFSCYSFYSPRLTKLIQQETFWTGYFHNLLHLSRFNGEVFQRSFYYLHKTDTTWLSDRVLQKQSTTDKKIPVDKFEFDQKAGDGYRAIIDLCKKNNIPYTFVVNPYSPAYNATYPHISADIQKLSDYLGEPIYNYSQAIKSEDSFSDYLHINKKGSREMMQILADQGIFNLEKN